MRLYTQNWDYQLTGASTPYMIIYGAPYAGSGLAVFEYNSIVSHVSANNYVGNYALQTTLDMTSANNGLVFGFLFYGMSGSFTPMFIKSGTNGIMLTWGTYVSGFGASNVAGADRGDFNDQTINAQILTVTYLKKPNGNSSWIAAHATDGTQHWFSGWHSAGDQYQVNMLGAPRPLSGSGSLTIGALSIADTLTASQIESVRLTGQLPIDAPSVVISANGNIVEDTQVTLSGAGDASWTIYYTLDGSMPNAGSNVYSSTFIVTYSPGTSTTIKAAYRKISSGSFGEASTSTLTSVVPAPEFDLSIPDTSDTDIPLVFTNVIPGVEILWITTFDDPLTSGTVYVPGQKIAFGSWMPDYVYPPQAYVLVTAVARHIATGVVSDQGFREFMMFVSDPVVSVPSGSVTQAFDFTVTDTSAGILSYVRGNASQIGLLPETVISSPATFHVDWSNSPVEYAFICRSADGLLESARIGARWTFDINEPVLTPAKSISSVPVTVSGYSTTPGAIVRYTLDGSEPSTTSPVLIGAVVAPGQIMKAAAFLGIGSSKVSRAEVQQEYEVLSVLSTQIGDRRYHCYETVQRCDLTSELGCSANVVHGNVNLSVDPMPVDTDNGLQDQMYVWDTGGSLSSNIAPVNGPLAALTVRQNQITRHWSRFCFSDSFNVEATLNLTQNLTDWLGNAQAPLVLVIASRKAVLKSKIRISGSNLECVSTVDYLGNMQNPDQAVVATAVPAVGTDLVFSFLGAGGSASISLDSLSLVSVAADLNDDWYVEISVGTETTAPIVVNSIPVSISSTSTVWKLRRAPLSMTGVFNLVDPNSTASSDPKSVEQAFEGPLDPVSYAWGSTSAASKIGWSKKDNTLSMMGFDGWIEYNEWVVDTTQDFLVEIDAEVNIVPGFTQNNNGPWLGIQLSAPGTSRDQYVSVASNLFLSYSVVVNSEDKYCTFGSLVAGMPRLNFRHHRKMKLRISKTGQFTRLAGEIDGLWLDLGPIDQNLIQSLKQATLVIKFRDSMSNSYPCSFKISRISMQGRLSRNVTLSPKLTGINFKTNGIGSGFSTYNMPTLTSGTYMVVLDRALSSVSVVPNGFEPTDTRSVLGIYEVDEFGYLSWTSCISSRLIRVRIEDANGLGVGAIVGAGHSPKIENGQLSWTESGIERRISIDDLSWHAPMNRQRGWAKKKLIRGVDSHRISLSLVSGRS